MKTAIAFAALIVFSGTAMAQQPANSVGKMVDALKGGGGGNNSPLKEALGLTGNGGVASYVSGGGNGGWGNVGSSITGDKVSSRPSK